MTLREPPVLRRRRLAAGAVDLAIAFALCLVPYLGWMAAAAFLFLRDHASLGGASPGKRLLGLELAGAARLAEHIRRNLTIAVPIVQLVLVPVEAARLAAGKRRLGEMWARSGPVVRASGRAGQAVRGG